MTGYDDRGRSEITTTEIDGKSLGVSMRIVFDGIEHVGRLWFAEEDWEDDGIPDRAAFVHVDQQVRDQHEQQQ